MAHSKLGVEARRALVLLSGSPEGCTEASLLAHGFTSKLIMALVQTELATAHTESVVANGRRVEIRQLKIADAGRVALVDEHL